MNVLIACEESQAVCKAFRARGHRAFSCDIQECSGGHPEWHIQGDALAVINGNCTFTTEDGTQHRQDGKWGLLIAHPPCTYLTVSGNRWFNKERYGEKAVQREREREDGAAFFMEFVNADCDHIAIENPIGYMNTHYRKADQIIQPFQFGHPARKATCLWLKGLPKLTPTNIVEPELLHYEAKSGKHITFSADYCGSFNWNDASDRRKVRSKTYCGIAEAMAEQWGNCLEYEEPYEPTQISLFRGDEQ